MAYNYIIELPLLLSFHRISSIAPGWTPEAVVAATQIPWSTPLTGWFCTRAVNYWVRKADDCQREAYRGTKLLFEIFKSGSFAASSSCRTAYDWRLSCGQVLDMEIVKTNSFSLRALHWTWSWRRALRRNQPTATSRVVNANVMFWILSLRLSDTLRWWRWDFWPKWRSMFRESASTVIGLGWSRCCSRVCLHKLWWQSGEPKPVRLLLYASPWKERTFSISIIYRQVVDEHTQLGASSIPVRGVNQCKSRVPLVESSIFLIFQIVWVAATTRNENCCCK